MKARFIVVIIERDLAEKIPVTVMLHEIPVLEAVHGKHISPAEIDPLIESVEIDPYDEYDRLANQYGMHESDIPFVERVFGRVNEFVAALEQIHGEQKKPGRGRPAARTTIAVTAEEGDEQNAG